MTMMRAHTHEFRLNVTEGDVHDVLLKRIEIQVVGNLVQVSSSYKYTR